MFGIDDMALAGGFSALANLGGGLISSAGQAGANAQNVQMQNQMNQQTLNAQMASHAQNTAFMEDAQAHDFQMLSENQKFNSAEAEKGRLFSSNEAGRQMAFQYDMGTSAYQRAMADMKKAGLNPILAYQQGGAPMAAGAMGGGSSASSSGGGSSMAHAQGAPNLTAPRVQNTEDAIGRALGNLVNSALDAARNHEGIHNVKADTMKKEQEGQHEGQKIEKTIQETYSEKERNKVLQEQQKLLREEQQRAKANTAAGYAAASVDDATRRNLDKYGSREMPPTHERILRALDAPMPRIEMFEPKGN